MPKIKFSRLEDINSIEIVTRHPRPDLELLAKKGEHRWYCNTEYKKKWSWRHLGFLHYKEATYYQDKENTYDYDIYADKDYIKDKPKEKILSGYLINCLPNYHNQFYLSPDDEVWEKAHVRAKSKETYVIFEHYVDAETEDYLLQKANELFSAKIEDSKITFKN